MAVGTWLRLNVALRDADGAMGHPTAKHKPMGTPPWLVRPTCLNAINDEAMVARLHACGAQASQKHSAKRGHGTTIGTQQHSVRKHVVRCR